MKKHRKEKIKKLNDKQKEKILWISVVLISGIILIGWMYNLVTSTSIKISNQKEEEQLPQITDFKEQLQKVKNQFKEFNLKNATSSDAEIKNIPKQFDATSTKTNNFNTKPTE